MNEPKTRIGSASVLMRAGGSLALALVALAPLPSQAAGDAILSQLAGNWIGRGTVKQSANADPERVYCKISNKLVNNGAGLEQRGRCAVATNSGQIKGTIQASGSGGYSGTLDTFNTRGPAKISGKAASNTINFNAEFVDRKTNKPTKATIKLVVADGKYRLVSNGANDSFVASDITFTPQ
ncbi:MAG: hypothetical protein KDK07_19015 [Bauldia sp.]|nr:hypothetical protein [Bauldia sp.]